MSTLDLFPTPDLITEFHESSLSAENFFRSRSIDPGMAGWSSFVRFLERDRSSRLAHQKGALSVGATTTKEEAATGSAEGAGRLYVPVTRKVSLTPETKAA